MEPEDTSDTALVEVSVLVARNPAAKSVLIQQQEVGGKVSRDPLPNRLSTGRRERECVCERESERESERERERASVSKSEREGESGKSVYSSNT